MSDRTARGNWGTPGYMAPEIILFGGKEDYDEKVSWRHKDNAPVQCPSYTLWGSLDCGYCEQIYQKLHMMFIFEVYLVCSTVNFM